MFLFPVLLILNIGHIFGAPPYLRTIRQGETYAILNITSPEEFNVCNCNGQTCQLNVAKADEACKVFKQRFTYFAEPSPYFLVCEFLPDSCTRTESEVPNVALRITYDAYELATSRAYTVPKSAEDLALRVFEHSEVYPHLLLNQKPFYSSSKIGELGFPVYFEGVLKAGMDKAQMFEYCETEECRKYIDKFCDGFESMLRSNTKDIMRYFLDCSVRHIYHSNGKFHIAWTMVFQHRNLLSKKIITTRASLESLLQTTAGHKFAELESYNYTGYSPLDVCQLTASVMTNQMYSPSMLDPFSQAYAIAISQYREWFYMQLQLGNNNCSKCIVEQVRFLMGEETGLMKLSTDIWVSLSCAKRKNMNTCADVLSEMKRWWNEGNKKWYNFWAPSYTIGLARDAIPFLDK